MGDFICFYLLGKINDHRTGTVRIAADYCLSIRFTQSPAENLAATGNAEDFDDFECFHFDLSVRAVRLLCLLKYTTPALKCKLFFKVFLRMFFPIQIN